MTLIKNGSIKPVVSIVIPAYNAGDYLLEAIESVINQTYPCVELIVVDDGSTDNTEALLSNHSGEFQYYRQENAGQSAAMNFGWQQSSGDILGYLSADDRLHPEAISSVVNDMLLNPDVVLAYPDFCLIDEHSNHLRDVKTLEYSQKLLIANFHCLPGPGALFQRKAWLAAGDWNITLRNIPDIDFFWRLSQQGPFLRVTQSLADFRIHSESTTYSQSTPERADEPIKVVTTFFEQQGISLQVREWKKSATANALMLSGFMHGYSGRYYTFIRRISKAAFISPSAVITKKMLSYLHGIFKKKSRAVK